MSIIERFNSDRGLDLKSSEINRDPRFASSMMNAQYRESGAAEKRRGFQKHAPDFVTFGQFKYTRVNAAGALEDIVLGVGRSLKKLQFTELVVTYTGAAAAAFISVYFDPTTEVYRCAITVGQTEVLNTSLGTGLEGSPVTIATLRTTIDALADITASVTGDGTVPAAFMKIVRDFDLVETGAWTGKAAYWTEVNSPITNPFDGSYTRMNDLTFENVAFASVSNLAFFSNGYDHLYKYDGQTLYRAGLPPPASLTAIDGGAGAITGDNYMHRAQYVQYDAAGNIVEGNTLATGVLTVVSKLFTVTVANIQAGTGFNTNCAIVAGAQVGVNQITVDDGSGGANTMKVGDTAYFFDGVSSAYVEREVTARSGTTITVAGAAVNVADNAVISNNLRIRIQRNKTSAVTPTVFYEVVELPNNSFAATQVYTDNTLDSALGALIEPPATDRSLPPKGKYIAAFQNLLFTTGNPADQSRIAWSDVDGPEYFPADTNQDQLQSSLGDKPNGIASNGSVLAVSTDNSIHIGSGTFGDNNYRFEEKALGIGNCSHASFIPAEGFLAWWSKRGPYYMAGGQLPQPMGPTADGKDSRIAPVMSQPGYEFDPVLKERFFQPKRVIGINWIGEGKALFFLPAETVDSGGRRYPNENSRVYAYDYTRDAWLGWSNIDLSGGACLYQDEFYFKNRRLTAAPAIASELHRMHNLNDAFDYQDNTDPIDWELGPQWEFLEEPGVLKKFLELQLFSLEETQNNDFTVTVKQEINFQRDAVIAQFDMQLTGAGYGQAAYGSEAYGDPSNPKFKHELARGRKAYATRTVFTNNEPQQNVVLNGWEILTEQPYRKVFKK